MMISAARQVAWEQRDSSAITNLSKTQSAQLDRLSTCFGYLTSIAPFTLP